MGEMLGNRPQFIGRKTRPAQGLWEDSFVLGFAKLDHNKPENRVHRSDLRELNHT